MSFRIRKDDPAISWMLPETSWYRGKVTFTTLVESAADDLSEAQCTAYLALPTMHPGAYAEEVV